MKNKIKGLLALALAAFTGGLWAGVTSSFGVNFTSNANQNIPADTAAGFAKGDYAQPTTWTNVSGGSGVAVINTNGKKLLSWTSRGTWNSSADTSTTDGKLLYNYLDDTVNSGRQKASVTITGLPADKQYAVALILSGDADNDGFNGKYSPAWINGVTYSYVDGALVTGDAAVAATTWGNRRAANKNGPTTPTEGQNVMFVEGLSGSVLSITSAMENQNTSRLTIAGIQVWVTDVDVASVTKPTDADVVSLNFHSAENNGAGAVGAETSSGLVAAKGWMDLTGANGTLNSLTAWNGEKTKNIAMGLNFKSKEFWGFNTVDAGYNYLRGYLDDGEQPNTGVQGATIELTNIPFEKYSVIVYAATDTENSYFHSVKIGDKWYVGNATQTAIGYATECYDGAKARWGASRSATAVYGTNALRLDGLTSESLTIQAGVKGDSARGGIAAIQIVNTGAKLSDAQVIDWTAQPADQLKISELPEITNPLVELKLAAGVTLIVDTLPTTALSLISTGSVKLEVTDLTISQAQLDAMFNAVGVTGGVVDDYTETLGYTMDGVTYPLIFRGTTDASWATLSNWYIGARTNGETTYWIPYTGTTIPGLEGSNEWRDTLVNGELMAVEAGADGKKTITIPASTRYEGWAPNITVCNGVHVVIEKMKKLQSDNVSGPSDIRVDDTSKITVETFDADSQCNGTHKFYVNAKDGVNFSCPAEGGKRFKPSVWYYFDDDGSVNLGYVSGSQTVKEVKLNLGDSSFQGKTIVSRKLIGFSGTANCSFEQNGVSSTSGVEVAPLAEDSALEDAEVGTYQFSVEEDGYYVNYVAYAPVAKIGDVEYATLQAAVDAAEAGAEITVIADIELTAFVSITKSFTLDLNGKSINRANGTALYVDGNVNITIQGEGSVSGSQAVYVNAGTVVIKGGNFHGYNGGHAVYVQGTGRALIENGTFSSDEGQYHYVLNKYDADRETTSIVVKGGKFLNFDPSNNGAEGPNTNFCAANYRAEAEGEWYVVKEGYTLTVEKPVVTVQTEAAANAVTLNVVAPEGLTEAQKEAYLGYFEKKITAKAEGGYTVELALKDAVKPVIAETTPAITFNEDGTVTVNIKNELPGLYYGVRYATTVEAVDAAEIVPGLTVTPAEGDTAGFFKVVVDFAPIATPEAE